MLTTWWVKIWTWLYIFIDPSSYSNAMFSAGSQTMSIKAWQQVIIPTQLNMLLMWSAKCYNPSEFAYITLWNERIEKDLLAYQWLSHVYGLTKFTDTDSFRPRSSLRRDEAAKMFVEFWRNVLCRQKNTVYNNQYVDIDNVDDSLKPYVIEAYEYWIMKWSNTRFRPADTITREEFVASLIRLFINRYLEEPNETRVKNYDYVFSNYWLDRILSINELPQRYDVSKIFFRLYYDQNYIWTNWWYVLSIENNDPDSVMLPSAPLKHPIRRINLNKPAQSTVLITPDP
jgi:hypothetical protein